MLQNLRTQSDAGASTIWRDEFDARGFESGLDRSKIVRYWRAFPGFEISDCGYTGS